MKAEIELLTLQKGEADDLSVRLPPADVFRKANIDYSGALLSVKFRIEQRSEDHYVVVLSSTQPINEPFLDLMVELDWPTGRLVREYTFLLDPPEYKPPQAVPAMATPVTRAPEIKSVEMPKQSLPEARPPGMPAPRAARVPESVAPKAIAPKAVAPKAAAPRAVASKAAAPKAVSSYQVKRGDTLTKIANANRPENVSLQQMLIALYRSNADQFDGDNINRIRAGKILNIPDAEVAASIDQEEATRTILAQAADFNEYRRKLGAAVSAAPERADERRQSVSGKITARVEDKPAAAKETKDQLKLSQTEEAGKPGAKRSAQGLQEDLFAKEKEIKEANERIAMLEKNLQDMQKLLELKSASGAQLQQQQQAAKAGAAKPVETVKAPEPAPAKPVEAQKAPEPAKAAEPAKAEEAAKAAPPAPAPKPAARKVAPPPPPPAPEPNLIDEILGNELALYGGGFLVLLFAGYFYYAWRRKKTLQQMESSILGAPDLATDAVFGAGAKADAGASEIQTEFGPSGAATAIDAEEVDPIAEADVYMAYGRDMQAEEILKEALAKDPSRQPIRVKLLEIYANRKDAKAFAAVATELQTATGGAGADWDKAAALGAQLDPGNPLYGGSQAEGHAVIDTQVVSGAERAPDIVQETGAEPESSPGLDFDLGLGEPEKTEASQAEVVAEKAVEPEASPGLDFDLGLGEPEQTEAPQPELAAEAGAEPSVAADLGFDLDLGGGDEKKTESTHAEQQSEASSLESMAAETPADAASSIDFDFELPGATEEAAPLQASAEPESLEVPVLEAPETRALEIREGAVPEGSSETPALEFPAVFAPESPEITDLELPTGSAPDAATEVPALEVPNAPVAEAAAGESGVDFDFNLDLPELKEEAPSAPLDLSSISLDLGAPGEAALSPDARWQEVATKLDLAKAYQEMGDMEGARELLDEVLKEGDTAQQQQAQTMLAALG